MNSKKTTCFTAAVCDFKNLGQKTFLILLLATFWIGNAQSQGLVCHELVCPDAVTVQIINETTCDTTLTPADFDLPTFIPGGPIQTDFTGEFDPANWTQIDVVSPQVVDHTTTDLTLTGANNPAFEGEDSYTDICITVPCDGRIIFDWTANMLNAVGNSPCGAFNRDEPAYLINGVETILVSDPSMGATETGTERICLAAGDEFCFRINSMNLSCRGQLIVDNFIMRPHQAVNNYVLIPPAGIVGNVYPPGTHTMQYEARLPGGCRDTCEFDLTVRAYNPGVITCQPINLSLNEIDCTAEITPDMVVTGNMTGCLDNYTVSVLDEYDNEIPVIDGNLIGQTVKYNICIPSINLCCWNYATIEDYIAPEIACMDAEVECNAIGTEPFPVVITNDCSDSDIILLDEQVEYLNCTHPDVDLYNAIITKTYTVKDGSGNQQETPCIQTIKVKRPDLSGITFDMTPLTLECNSFAANDDGTPVVSSVPMIDGLPIWPTTPEFLCNVSVDRKDDISEVDCHTVIVRTFTVREWHCSGEDHMDFVQVITIEDNTGPTFSVPADITVTVGSDFEQNANLICEGTIHVPGIIATDACHGIDRITIASPKDTETVGSGEDTYLTMEVGENLITYTAYDDCYNQTVGTMNITVQDERAPVAVCDPLPMVTLNTNGQAWIYAHDIDGGSHDECGPVTVQIAKMADLCDDGIDDTEFKDFINLCCEEVGTIMVILQATDHSGNTNQCMMEVQVANFALPVLIPPLDVTVECTTPYDLMNLSPFGDYDLIGGCSQNVEEEGFEFFNTCGLIEKIERTFRVYNNTGQEQNYEQTIYFVNSDPFDGDDPMDVSWPTDLIGADAFENICLTDPLNIDLLPQNTGEPTVITDACDQVAVSYTDKIFHHADPTIVALTGCYKIERTWQIVDWCQNPNGTFTKWDSVQYIEVINTIDPVISPDLTDDEIIKSCEAEDITFTATATTDCDDELGWTYEIFEGDVTGTLIDAGSPTVNAFGIATVVAALTDGEYEIIWSVSDGCGNSDTQSQNFTIENQKLPTAYAKSISVPLQMVGTEIQAEIWVSDIDNGSYHECDLDIELSFSCTDPTLTSLTFTCANVDPLTGQGTEEVTLCVTDELGNQNFVTTDIFITATPGLCTTAAGSTVDVTGRITSTGQENLPGVEVYLGDGEPIMSITDDNGNYAFEDMPLGGSYSIQPLSDEAPLNGVSTLDIVMIQKHVLGLSALEDPLQLIAADVNGSEDVSALDLVELRKMILGIYSAFPNNDSWNFIDAEHEFAVPTNPWLYGLPTSYEISNLQSNMDIPFIGVKVGDVNFSATAGLNDDSIDSRSNHKINMNLISSDSQLHEVTIEDLSYIHGLQFELSYAGEMTDIVSLKPGQLDIEVNNYYINMENETVSFSWNNAEGLTVSKDALFLIETTEQFDASKLKINSQRLKAEIYTNNEIRNLNLISNSRSELSFSASVYPNPWQESLQLDLDLKEAGVVLIEIRDVAGKIVYRNNQVFEAGRNQLVINDNDISIAGLYYCKIQNGSEQIQKKLIKMK